MSQDNILYKRRLLLEKWPITKEDLCFEILQDLDIKKDLKKYPYSTFFFKGDDYWFEISAHPDDIVSYLYCHRELVWEVFEKEYGLNYAEIGLLIEKAFEKQFKLNIKQSWPNDKAFYREVEKHFCIY